MPSGAFAFYCAQLFQERERLPPLPPAGHTFELSVPQSHPDNRISTGIPRHSEETASQSIRRDQHNALESAPYGRGNKAGDPNDKKTTGRQEKPEVTMPPLTSTYASGEGTNLSGKCAEWVARHHPRFNALYNRRVPDTVMYRPDS